MSRAFGNYASENGNQGQESSRKPYRYGSTVVDDAEKEDMSAAYDSEGAVYQAPAPVYNRGEATKNKKSVMIVVAIVACLLALVLVAGIAVAMYFMCCATSEDNTNYGEIVYGYISKGQECPQDVITAFQQQLMNNEEVFNENMQDLLGKLMPLLKEMQNGEGTQQDVMVLKTSMNALVSILSFAVEHGDQEEKDELTPLLNKFALIQKALDGDKAALDELQEEAKTAQNGQNEVPATKEQPAQKLTLAAKN